MKREDRLAGCFWGLAIGDALGAPVEFMFRDRFPEIRDMTAGGKFNLPAGAWTDDTAMALCLAQSLFQDATLNSHDLLTRFIQWAYHNENTSTGRAIGCGQNTLKSLFDFHKNGTLIARSKGHQSDGNGSLMRLAPVAIVHHENHIEAVLIARKQSYTTHCSTVAADCCALLAHLLCSLFSGKSVEESCDSAATYFSTLEPSVASLATGAWLDKSREDIQSDGFVVHTLESALWSIYRTSSFEEALICAVNLGHDADTVGAVTGQLAGAIYGFSSIPDRWKESLSRQDLLRQWCNKLIY